MRFLIYMGHPAHFHLFRNTISQLREKGHDVLILIKKKDILEELLRNNGWDYTNIHPGNRGDSKLAIAFSLLKRDLAFFKIVRKFKPDVMAGTSAEIAHIGKLLGIPSIVVNEDDAAIVPLFAKLAYPFASTVLAPNCCNCGKWEYKKTGYESYHELAYLHPDHFVADRSKVIKYIPEENYFIMRFAKLNAHHDAGRSGINLEIAKRIIAILSPYGKVYITSERELEQELEPYRIAINPLDIHHAMAFANLYIGDSQTMAAESAVLGTPAIRFNDFVGEIGYLEELEHKYGLTYGIRTKNTEELFNKLNELLSFSDLKQTWINRRNKMLTEKINLADYMTKMLINFPLKKR
jgi:uncharacterized protein